MIITIIIIIIIVIIIIIITIIILIILIILMIAAATTTTTTIVQSNIEQKSLAYPKIVLILIRKFRVPILIVTLLNMPSEIISLSLRSPIDLTLRGICFLIVRILLLLLIIIIVIVVIVIV